MARKRGSVIKAVREKEQEHHENSDQTPVPSAIENSVESPTIIEEYQSPDAHKFDNAGLKDLEQRKSDSSLGQNLSFEQHTFKI